MGTAGTEYVDNTNNAGRWVERRILGLIDQMGSLPVGDPQVTELMKQAVTIWADELPDIPLAQHPRLFCLTRTYWTDWPTADNNYIQPPGHWQHFLRVLTDLKPAQ